MPSFSTYYQTGFKNALVVSYDGMGEYETGMIESEKTRLKFYDNVHYPHSLVDLLGNYFLFRLKHHCDEGIIMGLAPFGNYKENVQNKKTYLDVFRDIYKTSH